MVSNKKNNNSDTFSKLSKIAASVLETANGAKNDLMKYIKEYCESLIHGMNFVKHEEFEVVKKLAIENKAAIDELLNKSKSSKKQDVSAAKKPIKAKSKKTEKNKSIEDIKK
ncbi:MAG: accessory factor UbiK family protein [Candidatus Lariskella arthropodorum]